MYYNKESSLNHDYYNAYGHTNREEKRSEILNTIIKLLAIVLLLSFILFGYIFVVKEQSLPAVPATESSSLPIYQPKQEEAVAPSRSSLSNQELIQIAQMVMRELDQHALIKSTPEATSPKVNLQDDDSYAQALLDQETDHLESTPLDALAMKNINVEKHIEKHLPTQKNHYNKVVIQPKEKLQKSDLLQLSSELENTLNEDSYTQEIRKELKVRSNEMRIIVVKKGDTLSKIAYRAYKDYNQYPKILRANPEVIQNPDQIFVGQRLRIPI